MKGEDSDGVKRERFYKYTKKDARKQVRYLLKLLSWLREGQLFFDERGLYIYRIFPNKKILDSVEKIENRFFDEIKEKFPSKGREKPDFVSTLGNRWKFYEALEDLCSKFYHYFTSPRIKVFEETRLSVDPALLRDSEKFLKILSRYRSFPPEYGDKDELIGSLKERLDRIKKLVDVERRLRDKLRDPRLGKLFAGLYYEALGIPSFATPPSEVLLRRPNEHVFSLLDISRDRELPLELRAIGAFILGIKGIHGREMPDDVVRYWNAGNRHRGTAPPSLVFPAIFSTPRLLDSLEITWKDMLSEPYRADYIVLFRLLRSLGCPPREVAQTVKRALLALGPELLKGESGRSILENAAKISLASGRCDVLPLYVEVYKDFAYPKERQLPFSEAENRVVRVMTERPKKRSVRVIHAFVTRPIWAFDLVKRGENLRYFLSYVRKSSYGNFRDALGLLFLGWTLGRAELDDVEYLNSKLALPLIALKLVSPRISVDNLKSIVDEALKTYVPHGELGKFYIEFLGNRSVRLDLVVNSVRAVIKREIEHLNFFLKIQLRHTVFGFPPFTFDSEYSPEETVELIPRLWQMKSDTHRIEAYLRFLASTADFLLLFSRWQPHVDAIPIIKLFLSLRREYFERLPLDLDNVRSVPAPFPHPRFYSLAQRLLETYFENLRTKYISESVFDTLFKLTYLEVPYVSEMVERMLSLKEEDVLKCAILFLWVMREHAVELLLKKRDWKAIIASLRPLVEDYVVEAHFLREGLLYLSEYELIHREILEQLDRHLYRTFKLYEKFSFLSAGAREGVKSLLNEVEKVLEGKRVAPLPGEAEEILNSFSPSLKEEFAKLSSLLEIVGEEFRFSGRLKKVIKRKEHLIKERAFLERTVQTLRDPGRRSSVEARLNRLDKILSDEKGLREWIERDLRDKLKETKREVLWKILENAEVYLYRKASAELFGEPLPLEEIESSKWRSMFAYNFTLDLNKRLYRKLLRRIGEGTFREWQLSLPGNKKFLEKLEEKHVNLKPWLEGHSEVFSLSGGRLVKVYIATDPGEILSIGELFKTCLRPGGAYEYNIVEITCSLNKRVLFMRYRDGKPLEESAIARMLIAINDEGGLMRFPVYHRKVGAGYLGEIRRLFLKFGEILSRLMGIDLADTGNVSALSTTSWEGDPTATWASLEESRDSRAETQ